MIWPKIRDAVAKRAKRGKIDCNLYFKSSDITTSEFELDENLLQQLVAVAHRVEVLAHNVSSLRTIDLLRWPGVIKTPETDTDALHASVLSLFEEALDDLIATREREGERIQEMIAQRLDAMAPVVTGVKDILPEIESQYRTRLQERVAELRAEVDPARLEQEIVVFAQRIDVHEELDRLATHLAEVRRLLAAKEPVGRRLDFLMQELNREANTLGSKAADIRMTNASVELKVLIEQMREQIQNIE